MRYYRLGLHAGDVVLPIPVQCSAADLREWKQEVGRDGCVLRQTRIGDMVVSTVFGGVAQEDVGPPEVFETVIFYDGPDEKRRKGWPWPEWNCTDSTFESAEWSHIERTANVEQLFDEGGIDVES